MAQMVLDREELEWIAELRNRHMGDRAAFLQYEKKAINERQLILKLTQTFKETDRILIKLGKRGI